MDKFADNFKARFLGKRSNRARDSLPRLLEHGEEVVTTLIGTRFPFTNREKQCIMFSDVLYDKQEKIRKMCVDDNSSRDKWETFKREIHVPVILGLSGIGKTSFARCALPIQAKKSSSVEDVQKRTFFEEFKDEINYLNVRIGLDIDLGREKAHFFLIEQLLIEWSKYDMVFTTKKKEELRSLLVQYEKVLNMESILQLIYDVEGIIPILVNLDEASKCSVELLKNIVVILGRLLTSGKKIFFSISGLYNETVFSAISKSSVERSDLFLPPLTLQHMQSILSQFGTGIQSANPHLQYLLWLTGGVPRSVEYLIASVAEGFNLLQDNKLSYSTVTKINKVCTNLTPEHTITIINKLKNKICVKTLPSMSSEIYSGLTALVIAEVEANESIKLEKVINGYCLRNALQDQLVYYNSVEKRVTIPPVTLHRFHNEQTSDITNSFKIRIPLLWNIDGVFTHRDNEVIYLCVVQKRMQAFSLIGRETVPLSKLLGISIAKRKDFQIKVESTGSVRASSTTITAKCLEDILQLNFGEGIANTRTAECADGFLKLRDAEDNQVLVFIQEKQSVVSREKQVRGGNPPKTVYAEDVLQELEKALKQNQLSAKVVYVYSSDNEVARNETKTSIIKTINKQYPDVLTQVITPSNQQEAFGSYLHQLKLHALSD
jgi:hypothetical protein